MKLALITVLVCNAILTFGQTYQVGHTTHTFNDPARTGGFGSGGGPGRQIQAEIYYPGVTAGEDVLVETGTFPVIIFGHGFVMAWDAYNNIWSELVSQGYIMVFPRTEGGFSPDHAEFGMDLRLCVTKMQELDTTTASLFLGHVDPNSAIMGHSMGGGATILAGASNTDIKTIVGLAPAETNPSAISDASQVLVPSLILSGGADGVTPPNDHHIPIYHGLNVSCKYFINIIGGAHCYFANPNFNCDFGESTSSSGISISRMDQQTVMNDYIVDWFDYQLKQDAAAKLSFDSLLLGDTRVSYMDSCSSAPSVGVINNSSNDLKIYPNPSTGMFSIDGLEINTQLSLYTYDGRLIMTQKVSNSTAEIDLTHQSKGIYLLIVVSKVADIKSIRLVRD